VTLAACPVPTTKRLTGPAGRADHPLGTVNFGFSAISGVRPLSRKETVTLVVPDELTTPGASIDSTARVCKVTACAHRCWVSVNLEGTWIPAAL
jgi:hypothetical protein